jgi:hypothetical protein
MNHIKTMIVGLIAITMPFLMTGCNPDQIKVACNQAGLFSAVGWVALDNPDINAKSNVCAIAKLIEDNASKVQQGQSYVEVIYPIISMYVDIKVEPQYRPLTKAGSLALLSGIDMLFAAHPEWKSKQSEAIVYVTAFCNGAITGLNMKVSDPIMQTAIRNASFRTALKVEQTKESSALIPAAKNSK